MASPFGYATAPDLAHCYGVPLGTIYRWASEDQWDRTRYRPIRYSRDDAERSYKRRAEASAVVAQHQAAARQRRCEAEREREARETVRFWSKVERTEGCWLWTGSTSHGYGVLPWMGLSASAHRVAYQLKVGAIPDGLEIDHLCNTRACVRPDHLQAVTHQVNMALGVERRRARRLDIASPAAKDL